MPPDKSSEIEIATETQRGYAKLKPVNQISFFSSFCFCSWGFYFGWILCVVLVFFFFSLLSGFVLLFVFHFC